MAQQISKLTLSNVHVKLNPNMAKTVLLFLCIHVLGFTHALFKDIPNVEHLTRENFEKKVLKSERVWLVEFYDPKNEACKKTVPEIEKTAKILAGIAKIGVVDVSENERLAHEYDSKETVPNLLLFGADKEKPTLYKDKLEAMQIIKKVGAQVKSMVRNREEKEPNPKKDVVKLTADNFEKKVLESDGIWFVKYYDPNCVHSKQFAPEYAKAASALKGAVNVGAVNMDVELYDKMGEPYNIDKVPLVKIFGVDKVTPAEYSGARKHTELIDRALEEMEMLVRNRIGKAKKEDELYGGIDESGEEDAEKKKAEEAKTHTIIGKGKDDHKAHLDEDEKHTDKHADKTIDEKHAKTDKDDPKKDHADPDHSSKPEKRDTSKDDHDKSKKDKKECKKDKKEKHETKVEL